MDKMFLESNFKVHTEKLIPYSKNFEWIENGENLYIFGNPGTQKTGQVVTVCKNAIDWYKKNKGVNIKMRYYAATGLHKIYYKPAFDDVKKCKLLVLDNVGRLPEIEDKYGLFFEVIDYRGHNGKSTIVITNVNLKAKIDLALWDRFNMYEKIKIDGNSTRKVK